ncbi:hypothetical protein [Subtercola boreus]|uniref:hypothetical protein n=1 Tax=Subtercola boreus TaxID=120213 RepID=UPI0015596EA4|nr:hypothetical protein [Subtercola boreus]
MTEHSERQLLEGVDSVLAIVQLSGRCDAWDYIDGLADQAKAHFQRYFEYLAEGKHIRSPEKMRHLATDSMGNEVHELKVHLNGGSRVYVVKHGDRWFATHGSRKPKDSRVPTEIGVAWAVFYEWYDREK